MIFSPHEHRLLEIETARVRHAWAKAQIESAGSTPALEKYLNESLCEFGFLKANDLEMELTDEGGEIAGPSGLS
jgi:hypothetical protein